MSKKSSKLQFKLQKNHSKAFYEQLRDELRATIESGILQPGDDLPSLKELARLADVSIFTADRAIEGLIQEGLLIRRPKKGTYVAHPGSGRGTAAEMAQGGSVDVVFCVCPLHRRESTPKTYYGLMMMGIQKAAQEDGVTVISSMPETIARDIAFYALRPGFNILGAIFVDHADLKPLQAAAMAFPEQTFVLLNAVMEGFELTAGNVFGVFNDDFGGGYKVASSVFAAGYRRPAVITRGLKVENYRLRVEGIQKAAAEYGISMPESMVFLRDEAEDNYLLAIQLTEEILKTTPLPDVILCVSDQLAYGARKRLSSRKKDAAVIDVTGFDGLQSNVENANDMTTVVVDFEKIGRMGCEVVRRARKERFPKMILIADRLLPKPGAIPEELPLTC